LPWRLTFRWAPWRAAGCPAQRGGAGQLLTKLTLSQVAPILPYLFLVLILIFRPRGLLGTREG
jgi:branched-chain amino acid transport system permease protein